MTEAELQAHRAERRDADKATAEREADQVAWTLRDGAAIEFVDRSVAVNDRAAHRALVAEMVAMRITGHTLKEIADATGTSPDTVRRYLAHAAEVAQRNDVAVLLDYHAVPLAVDNLITGLKNGDKQYTLKVLEGRGHFQKHTKGTTAQSARGVFSFEWKGAPQAAPQLPEGAVQGVARSEHIVEGEVIDDDK